MMILLGLAYYVRGRIGPARWRSLHRFTALAWVLGVVHTLGEGTDAGAAWFLITAGALVLRTLVTRTGVSVVIASEHDILDGIALSLGQVG
jgi:DMSO/TMAO reductase YedYZ heme-binding membrane subunit